jgi:hypothetical protein
MIAAACGKVGDPKPPINRTPRPVGDLSVQQSGYKVTLTWTNPARYVGDDVANDLAFVHILRNGMEIAKEPVSAPGKPQSKELDVRDILNSELTFAIQIETQRGKASALSKPFPITPLEVPGVPRNLDAKTDQQRIILDWDPPDRNPELAAGYIVQRSDRPTPAFSKDRHWEDAEFEKDKMYDYTVTAVRDESKRIPGLSGVSLMVTATDKFAPSAPTGLVITSVGDGVFLQWQPNPERDVTQYFVFRSDKTEKVAAPSVDGYQDSDYKPGLSYWLIAVDESGNESPKSPAQRGP